MTRVIHAETQKGYGGETRQKRSCCSGKKKVRSRTKSTWRSESEHFDFVRQRFLLLKELQATMATFARPVASTINGVDFNVYSEEEIKALSVKRIHNTPTLDSFNNPVPGGLQDPAMGAWGDHV